MKTKSFLLIIFIFLAGYSSAQTDNSTYLSDAWECLYSGDCVTAKKNYDMYKAMSGEKNLALEKAINECDAKNQKTSEKKTSKKDLMDNSYCHANKNRYVAWSIAGAGYPWNLVSGVEFRAGGLVGVGLYGDIGVDFTNVEYTYYDGETIRDRTVKTAFRYAGGIKFYPYKGLFVDCGYGTISKPFVDGISVPYYGWGEGKERENDARKAVVNSHGILFHAGYNLVTNLSNGAGFFLGLSGGASYDVINKVFAPSVNLKLGVAWGWHK